MHSPLPLVAALLFLLPAGACRANLGDTEAQCIARFGAEVDVQTDVGYRQVGDKAAMFHYKTAGAVLDVRVVFLNGLSCHETYSNDDSSQGLSESQMKAILDAQSARQKWSKGRTALHTNRVDSSGVTSGSEEWQRDDGVSARFWLSGKSDSQAISGEVEISTRQYADAQRYYDKQNGDQ